MKSHKVVVGDTFLGNLTLEFFEISGNNKGVTLGLISGIHGDELSSIGGHLMFLNEIKCYPPDRFCGRIFSLTFANL
jgi:hypothetical protein